jgi:hypothetical protein
MSGPRSQRRLMAARRALQQRAVHGRRGDAVALRTLAPRAAKALGPAELLQSCGTLLLAAKALHELADRHPGLDLDFVDRHNCDSVRQRSQVAASVAHQMSLLRFLPNQVPPDKRQAYQPAGYLATLCTRSSARQPTRRSR